MLDHGATTQVRAWPGPWQPVDSASSTGTSQRSATRRVRFHDLRHSCATLPYEQGVKIENIQDVLGHSSPTITKTLYVDPTDKVLREAVDKLGFPLDE